MGRKNTGKTATIRERTINIYLPDLETVDKWKEAASESNTSLSKFVIQKVEFALNRGSPKDVQKLEKEIATLREQCESLGEENRGLKEQMKRLYKEIELCRSQLLEEFSGRHVGEVNRQLVDILRAGPKTEKEILAQMEVEPGSDEARAISTQLAVLLDMELVMYDGKVWRWTAQ